MKVIVSAPGKIHLLGEHTVVYSRPALLTAIDRRVYVAVSRNSKGINSENVSDHEYISYVLEIVRQHLKLDKIPHLQISITSQLKAGFHLGSSAATAAATIGALLYFLKKIWNPHLVNKLAYEAEKKQHGNPSGGDNTVVTFGGFIFFRKEFEFLKSIWQLPFKLPHNLNHFYLINTGKPIQSTKDMVDYVKSKVKTSFDYAQDKQNSKIIRAFNENEQQVKKLTLAIKTDNEKELLSALKIGQKTLQSIGVVSQQVKPVIADIEKNGGAAKILGAGARSGPTGYLLAYHRHKLQLTQVVKRYKYSCESVNLGEEGIRLEKRHEKYKS